MPAAVAEPPIQEQAPSTPQDGGFLDRMNQTVKENPFGAPQAPSAPPTPEKTQDAPTGKEMAKEPLPEAKAEPVKVEANVGASEMLKNLAKGEPKEELKTPPTPEQKREYSAKELRLRAESAEKDLAAARKEIETAKSQGASPDEIKALTKERDEIRAEREEYKKKLAAVDVSQSEQYVKGVTEPMEAIWKGLKKDSEEFKFSWEGMTTALNIPDHRQRLSALSRVLENAVQKNPESGELEPLEILKKNDIVNAVSKFIEFDYYGQRLLADSVPAQAAIKAEKARKEAEEKETSTKTFHSHAENIFNQMFSEESLADMPFLAPKGEDGKPVPDKTLLDQIRKSAISTKEPWRQALDSYSTELLPVVMEYAKKSDAKIAELEERIGKLSGAGPKGGGAITHEEGGDPDDNLTLQERVEKEMKAQGRL